MKIKSARAKRADQKRYSKAEMKDRGETGKLAAAVIKGYKSFESTVRKHCGKDALTRIAFSARLRKMSPLNYTAKVLLKK